MPLNAHLTLLKNVSFFIVISPFSVSGGSQHLAAHFMELLDRRKLIQKPLLDFLIRAGLSQCILGFVRFATQHFKLCHDGLLLIIMSLDVLLHVVKGQTLVVARLLGGGSGHN